MSASVEISQIVPGDGLSFSGSNQYPEVTEESELENLLHIQLKKKKNKDKKNVHLKDDQPNPESSSLLSTSTENDDYTYMFLLQRISSSCRVEQKKISIPIPRIQRMGSKKTVWANFSDTCSVLRRSIDHFKSFIQAELSASCSIDGTSRLIVVGIFVPNQFEELAKKYIQKYVICNSCKTLSTLLQKDSITRLWKKTCDQCHSSTTVEAILSGPSIKSDKKHDKKRE